MNIASCLLTIIVSITIPCKAMQRTAAQVAESTFHSVLLSGALEHPPLPSGIKVLQGDLCFLRQLRPEDAHALCLLITAISGTMPTQEESLNFITHIQACSCAIFINSNKHNILQGIVVIDTEKGILHCIIHPHFFLKSAFSEAMQLLIQTIQEENPVLDNLTAVVETHDQSPHPTVYKKLGFDWVTTRDTGRFYHEQNTCYPIQQTVFTYQVQNDWKLI